MRTFWLSFVDPDRPEGQQFLGVTVVDVSDNEVASIVDEIRDRFPNAKAGAEWIAAATRKAWSLGCNPGGEVGCAELPSETCGHVPRNRLLTREEAARFGGVPLSEQ
jgi:hypothetical protein